MARRFQHIQRSYLPFKELLFKDMTYMDLFCLDTLFCNPYLESHFYINSTKCNNKIKNVYKEMQGKMNTRNKIEIIMKWDIKKTGWMQYKFGGQFHS